MLSHLSLGRCDQQASGHAEMHDPLSADCRRPAPIAARSLQVEDDVFANPSHMRDVGSLQNCRDFSCWRFQWLWLLAEPDRFDNVARDALVETSGNGFDFGQFGHSIQFTANGGLRGLAMGDRLGRSVGVCAPQSETCRLCCYTARLTLISPNFGLASWIDGELCANLRGRLASSCKGPWMEQQVENWQDSSHRRRTMGR